MSIWERYDDLVASNVEDQAELTRLRAQQTVLAKALTAVLHECRVPACTPGGRWHDEYYDALSLAEKALATLDVPDTKDG